MREADANEGADPARRYQDRNRCVVTIGPLLDNREAESTAIASDADTAIEPLEHLAALGFGNADATILDTEIDVIAIHAAADAANRTQTNVPVPFRGCAIATEAPWRSAPSLTMASPSPEPSPPAPAPR